MSQRSILFCLFGLAIGNLANQPLLAQSLFERRSQNQVDQYRGYVARNRGDVLTVLINESTDVENRDERRLDKSSSATANAQFNYGLGGDLGKSAASLTYGQLASSARDFSGDTEFRSERQFSDRFAVTVDDVLPNGNLVVSGKRLISVQGDLRELRLNGIVRQYDVLPNNVVPSSLVADLRIQLDAKGAEQAFSNQGWFSKRVNRWWPF
ncbi:MAG: flagellar basal body L-ring protein FlgH [bacterium]|nr:flagellar basal body L-ring protein FlgH [bacterium]